jgi:hypothetical protein
MVPKIVVPSELAATLALFPFFALLELLLELEPHAATASAATAAIAQSANALNSG